MFINIVSIVSSLICEVCATDLRSVGGRFAKPSKYSYIVRIGEAIAMQSTNGRNTYSHRLYCSAVVVVPEWSISAAHCFNDIKTNKTVLVIVYDDQKGKRVGTLVNQVLVHPNYRQFLKGSQRYFVYNDIGLVRHNSIILNKYAKLSTVDHKALYGAFCGVTGFGEGSRKMIYPDNLLILRGVVTRCDYKTGVYPSVCAARQCEMPKKAYCSGESGGPLIHVSGVIAINAVSENSCIVLKSNRAGVYTPLAPYLRWIRLHVNLL